MQTDFRTMMPLLANTSAQSASRAGAISSDFQTFLRMLTTQMQNQNPLEPIQASDFAAQLATFSGVEQQVRTNELLSELSSRMGLSELASWVGKYALSPAPIYLDGETVQLVPPEVGVADRAELIISGLDGRETGRYPVDPFATELFFEAPHASDGGFPSGYYQFSMESFRAGASLGVHPVLGYARIDEARMDAGHVLLVLQGGHIIDSKAVIGLRG
jgi:flagellar basal-body rod modification protein FlgD